MHLEVVVALQLRQEQQPQLLIVFDVDVVVPGLWVQSSLVMLSRRVVEHFVVYELLRLQKRFVIVYSSPPLFVSEMSSAKRISCPPLHLSLLRFDSSGSLARKTASEGHSGGPAFSRTGNISIHHHQRPGRLSEAGGEPLGVDDRESCDIVLEALLRKSNQFSASVNMPGSYISWIIGIEGKGEYLHGRWL